MTKYIATITEMIVHTPGEESPLYCGNGTIIKLVDEGGGPFFELQNTDDAGNSVRLELEELQALNDAAQALMRQLDREGTP